MDFQSVAIDRIAGVVSIIFTRVKEPASLAKLVLGDRWFCELRLTFSYRARAAGRYSVGIIMGDGFLLRAWIEPEHAAGVVLECLFAASARVGGIGDRIFRLAHLDHRAAAVPAIRKQELLPERVREWQSHPIECSVFLPDAIIAGRSILQIIVIAIGRELLPSRRHLRRRMDEIIFSAEVMAIVSIVDSRHLLIKLFERLYITVRTDQSRERLIHFVNRGRQQLLISAVEQARIATMQEAVS